jgi:DNA-binding response OmpR family regulator
VNTLSPAPSRQGRILIVDDEATIRRNLGHALSHMGYEAEQAANGVEALAKLSSSSFDLMLLDLHMPEMDGIEVMKRARESCPGLLVIVLTGHATLDSAIVAVKAGAVDYLLKPSTMTEIEAAISRALEYRRERLRRQHLIGVIAEALDALKAEEERDIMAPSRLSEQFLQVGPVTLDQEKLLAMVDGAGDAASPEAKLTGNEAALLAFLMQHPDRVFSCRELAREALGYDVSDREAQNIVRPHVSRLRRKIEQDLDHPQLIRTIHGKGYLFHAL